MGDLIRIVIDVEKFSEKKKKRFLDFYEAIPRTSLSLLTRLFTLSIDLNELYFGGQKTKFSLLGKIQVNTFDDCSSHESIFDRVST
jgi:hypothetical protein